MNPYYTHTNGGGTYSSANTYSGFSQQPFSSYSNYQTQHPPSFSAQRTEHDHAVSGQMPQVYPEGYTTQFLIRDVLKVIAEAVAVIEGIRMILLTVMQWFREVVGVSDRNSFVRRFFRFVLSSIRYLGRVMKPKEKPLGFVWSQIALNTETFSGLNAPYSSTFASNQSLTLKKLISFLSRGLGVAYPLTGLLIMYYILKSWKKYLRIRQKNRMRNIAGARPNILDQPLH